MIEYIANQKRSYSFLEREVGVKAPVRAVGKLLFFLKYFYYLLSKKPILLETHIFRNERECKKARARYVLAGVSRGT